ncbi:MAG: hypothetical protein QOJ63_3055 [Solirubrobacteraceae bacterium]|jgi:hypothetical protein|nr:hypothetical protein [Solirubrobacteraceae bacterium]
MAEPPTPAHAGDFPLKREGVAFDSCRAMRTQELKLSIQRADYVVDPVAVAEAMLRHALSHRRWWNPIALCVTPPADSVTSGWPPTTDPTQVNGAARSAARRSSGPTQTQSS